MPRKTAHGGAGSTVSINYLNYSTMELKQMLLFVGTCLCADLAAQTASPVSNIGSAAIQPHLHSVASPQRLGTVTRFSADLNAVRKKAEAAPVGSRPALVDTRAAENKLRLDSIVQQNPDGSYALKQYFVYNDMGKETQRKNWYWDTATASWGEPTEQYDFTWNDDGLILVEQVVSYGSGMRMEYVYNEQGLGIQQTNYQLNIDGEWEPTSKGEYDYDDAGNMIEEMLYTWDGSQWVSSTHNYATWDAKKRQTSYTGYTWNGTEWVGSSKGDYVWFDGPRDPDYVEGTEAERMTYKGDYVWKDGNWQRYYIFTNSFNEDGRLSGQSELYYNRQYGKWCGGDNWDGLLYYNTSWKSAHHYDDHGARILDEMWECLPDSTEWLYVSASPTVWEYDEEGNREGLYRFVQNLYDAQNNKIGESCTQQTYYGYNANNKRTWVLDQVADAEGNWQSLFEEKYVHNEAGLNTLTLVWDWVDGKRTPTSRIEYKYNEDGQLTETLSQNGGGGGLIPMGAPATRGADVEPDDEEGWVNSSLWTYEYDHGVMVDKRGYMWRNGDWATNNGVTTSYDFDYSTADLIVPEGWNNPYKIDWQQNLYSDGSNGWMASSLTYYYTEPTATGLTTLPADGAETGLNIAQDYINVTTDGNTSLKVYSVGGTLVRESGDKQVYIGDLPAGIYVASMNGQNVKFVKR